MIKNFKIKHQRRKILMLAITNLIILKTMIINKNKTFKKIYLKINKMINLKNYIPKMTISNNFLIMIKNR